MKTFEQALEEAAIEYEPKRLAHGDYYSFQAGAQWAVQNLHLLPAKDLLKHEDVKRLYNSADGADVDLDHAKGSYDFYSAYHEELKEALKPFTEEK